MVHHAPKLFWPLLLLSYGLIIGAVYSWVEAKNWPWAMSTIGSLLLLTFMLVTLSYVSGESVLNGRAIDGMLEREGKGYTRHADPDSPPASIVAAPVVPVVVKAQIEPDPAERNLLIAKNSAELQKTQEQLKVNSGKLEDINRRLGAS